MKVGDVEIKRVQRRGRKVLLVPEIRRGSCYGCVFSDWITTPGSEHCSLAYYKDGTQRAGAACMPSKGADDDDADENYYADFRIYIDPDKLPEYLAVRAAAILEKANG